jgi:hypothetical protein
MKNLSIYFACSVFCMFAFTQCNREKFPDVVPQSEEVYVVDGRLCFSSIDVFNNLAEEFHNGNNFPRGRFDKVYSLNYSSLKNSKEILLKNGLETDDDTDEFAYDLVPDEFFSSLLNDKYEIEVNGIIYKVSCYGTFILAADKLSRLNSILDGEDQSVNMLTDLSSHKFFRNEVETDVFKIEEDIFLFDTFKKKVQKTHEVIVGTVCPLDDVGSIINTSSDPYGNMDQYTFGASTIMGKLIQGLIGYNEIQYRKWGSDRRLRVNFYDTNYGVYAALGLSGKFQVKNWIGWSMSGKPMQEMRMGVQALKFESYSYDASTVPFSNNPIPNYNWPSPPMAVNSDPFINFDLLGCHHFYVSESTAAQVGVKECYNFLKSRLGSSTPPDRNLSYQAWTDVNKTKAKLWLGLNETVKHNTNEISKIFSWGTGIIVLTWNSGGGLVPGVGGKIAASIKIQEANVFVTGLYDNKWQGIRVVMK